MRDKLAFIHFGKAGGNYVNSYLHQILKFGKINSWHRNSIILCESGNFNRDWTEEELLNFVNLRFEKPVYVHNHHNNWSHKTVNKYNDNGWFTFMFIRDPRDVICSLYFFAHKLIKECKATPLGSDGTLAGHLPQNSFETPDVTKLTLDEFVRAVTTNPKLRIFWKLPAYVKLIQYVQEMNDSNFGAFCSEVLNHAYTPREHLNVTENRGYNFYLSSGRIDKSTDTILTNTSEFNEYKEYLDI